MNTYRVKVTDKEIDDILNKFSDAEAEGRSKFRGMTYEQGVIAALDWILGNTDSNPLDD